MSAPDDLGALHSFANTGLPDSEPPSGQARLHNLVMLPGSQAAGLWHSSERMAPQPVLGQIRAFCPPKCKPTPLWASVLLYLADIQRRQAHPAENTPDLHQGLALCRPFWYSGCQ